MIDIFQGIHIEKQSIFLFIGLVSLSSLFFITMYALREISLLSIDLKSSKDHISEIESELKTEKVKSTLVEKTVEKENIVVDISGSVRKPGVYTMEAGDRLHAVIEMAGGLVQSADSDYFNRNYNLASLVYDQEKIYVPSQDETQKGIFIEQEYTVFSNKIDGRLINDSKNTSETSGLADGIININTASSEELESLSGIGPKTAEKIIQNRPYSTKEELVSKGALGEKLLESINALITL